MYSAQNTSIYHFEILCTCGSAMEQNNMEHVGRLKVKYDCVITNSC